MNPKVDGYFSEAEKWQNELKQLRSIVLDCRLSEELKWRCPCYTFNDKNVVLIHAFKDYCALLFFKGSLLADRKKILVQQSENVQAGRQIRFTGLHEITRLQTDIRSYIYEAVEIEKAGLQVQFKKVSDFKVAEEFERRLNTDNDLKTAFENLTAGRQRAYLLHFIQPKQSKTREARVEKNIPRILQGKGLNE